MTLIDANDGIIMSERVAHFMSRNGMILIPISLETYSMMRVPGCPCSYSYIVLPIKFSPEVGLTVFFLGAASNKWVGSEFCNEVSG